MSSSSIKVAVRCRPLFGQERPTNGLDIHSRRILLDSKTYDPDYTFPPTASQEDVFHACRPILQCVKEGMNGTIMVYGQTGTGKTFTMLGRDDGNEHGLVHKVVDNMLEHVQQKTADGAQCALTLSMIEIYNERLTDMLSPNGEDEVTLISGFPRFTNKATLCRVDDAIETIQKGLAWRHTAATLMNERSSRSHVVFIFDFEEYNAFTEQTDVAHLFMVDLAGSESLKKSQASGAAAGEAGKINKSLLALKSVFLALSNTNEATRPGHVPYRDSKLTELLQDSIGGTARTLMIACISSVGRDIEETKSTLLYAVKARSIRNAANTEREKLLVRLRSMEVENQKLRNRLQERVNERGGYYVTKEEHEQTQAMAESFTEMKAALEQLMQDRQNSDARQHISESQVKVLHVLLEEKAAELQRFKEIYYEALRRFEHQATALQTLVRGGVNKAKDVVQGSFADHYTRLHSWRTELLNALEEPLPSSVPEMEGHAERDRDDARLQHIPDDGSPATPSPPSSPQDEELARTAQQARSSNNTTPQTSPSRNNGGAGGQSSNTSHAHTNTYAVPGTTTTTSTGGSSNNNNTGRSAISQSARGSTASTQRVSMTSTVSPTRRGTNIRQRFHTSASANLSRRATQAHGSTNTSSVTTSPSLLASHIPLPPPMSPLPGSTAKETCTVEPDNEESAAVTRGVAFGEMSAATVDASAPLQVSSSAPPPPSPAPAWSSVLSRHDALCIRAVHRLNDAIAAMLAECLRAFDAYKANAERVEARRRHGLEDVCVRLRRELDAHLTQLQRADAANERDLQDARDALEGELRLKATLPVKADAAPFQQAVRGACTDVVRHAAYAFPHPRTPPTAEASLDTIAETVRRCRAGFTAQALDPLSSSALALASPVAGTVTTTSSSPASSPRLGKGTPAFTAVHTATGGSTGSLLMLDLPSMPSLVRPAASFAESGVQRDEPSVSPAMHDNEEQVPSDRSSSVAAARETRSTGLPAEAPTQGQSARASSRRSSSALSAVPVNSNRCRGAGGGAAPGRCKRTRSFTASSQGGSTDGSPRRTMMTRRTLR